MLKRFLGLLLTLAVTGCAGGSVAVSTLSPLHDVYEATNVALPDGSGSGSIVFAFSENGTAGSPVSGEIVLVAASHMSRLPLQSGVVTRAGSSGTIQGITLNPDTNRTTSLSGSLSSSTYTYSLSGSTTTNGTAARVSSYIDNDEAFVPPSGFLGTFAYIPLNTSCVSQTIYDTISGAQSDGSGLWRPQGAVNIGAAPSPPFSTNDGVWDGGSVFALVDLGGGVINPLSPTLSLTLAGTSDTVAQFGATPCVTPVTPPPP